MAISTTGEFTIDSRLSAAARSLWAKTNPDDPVQWLSLPQHLTDTVGVARYIWATWASVGLRTRIAELAGLREADTGTLYAWLAGVHDIGKATKSFQCQLDKRRDTEREAFADRVRAAGLPLRMNAFERSLPRFPHALASKLIVETWLIRRGASREFIKQLPSVLDAHHGLPTNLALAEGAEAALDSYEQPWLDVHRELLDYITELTGALPVLQRNSGRINADALQLLTGLVIMADWIASNQDLFPLTITMDQEARLSKGLAVDLTEPWQPAAFTLANLDKAARERFGWPDSHATRPVQRATAQLCLAKYIPFLLIIEAPTGEGKTETAFLGAELLASRTGVGGVIVAAPTMATADGLFTRTLAWARQASANSAVSSMFLGHSKAFLNTDFSALKSLHAASINLDDHDAHGSVTASQWLSGRKKGLLSNFVVSTVDQVLMLALESKHSMLRHLALANKVVIIDEVHAYGTYMSEYLARALEWLARYRVPVILLSATLPLAQKRKLLSAYSRELTAEPIGELSSAYPLITAVTEQGLVEQPVTARPADMCASVELLAEDSPAALTSLLNTILGADGGCVLVICNTVRRAQEVFDVIAGRFPGEVELHHASFTASERARKEEALRAKLGPTTHRGSGRPHRRIVVATQVAEQSLDIDVDALITDIAPIDLMIQRIGRLHRHRRPESDRPKNLRTPRVWVRGVDSLPEGGAPTFAAGITSVYEEAILIPSLALVLTQLVPKGFNRPNDVPDLVQRAYSPSPPLLEGWEGAWAEARERLITEDDSATSRAHTYRMPPPSRAASLRQLFEKQTVDVDTARGEHQGFAQVRDSDPSIEVIPILRFDEGYTPLPHHGAEHAVIPRDASVPAKTAYALAAATVRLPHWLTRTADDFERVVGHLERATPPGWLVSPWLAGQLALPLDPATRSIELGGVILEYSDLVGLRRLPQDAATSPLLASATSPEA